MTGRDTAARAESLRAKVGFVAGGLTGAIALAMLAVALLVTPWAS